MESSPIKSTTHPLVLIAAASVAAVSLAGVGYLAGWLPGPGGKNAESAALNPVAQVAPVTPPTIAPQTTSQPVGEATVKAGKLHSSSTRATASPAPTSTHSPSVPATCANCGVVASINEVMVEPEGTGAGAVAGGVLGGVLGNQIGRGNGRTVATVLGAVGGAVAGNAIEKSVKKTKRYDAVVRFDDGTTRTFSSATLPAWRNGDRVRLQNGVLTPRD